MPKSYVKKTLTVAVILLFLSVSVIPSTGTTDVKQSNMLTTSGNILYVGGNGTGNYSKIQDAIDDASDGDTVFVYDDSSPYYENVVVNKTINIIGEDRNTTVIDGNGSGDVVYVSADWVNISGFKIRNSGYDVWQNAGIDIRSNNNFISSNSITMNNGSGIQGWFNNSNISDNNITMNNGAGMVLQYFSNNNTITVNTISNNDYGISLAVSNNNIITGNNISNNYYHGIGLWMAGWNTINGNSISSNKGCGIIIDQSESNIITRNSIFSNSEQGILLDVSWDNTIECNNIENNEYGLGLGGGTDNLIKKNNFILNKRHTILALSRFNVWDSNYWDNWIGLKINLPIFQKFPKVIFSYFPLPPWIMFDWHPASEPYDIGV